MRWAEFFIGAFLSAALADGQSLPENAKPCFASYLGVNGPADKSSARACFEAETVGRQCSDLANLDLLFLAVMYLDGQGGPVDFGKARALVAGCQDGTRKPIEEEIASREEIAPARDKHALDYCDVLAGTTLDSEACGQLADWEVDTRTKAAETEIRAKLNTPDRGLFDAWGATLLKYARFDAAWRADRFRGGTIRSLVYAGRLNELRHEHLEELRALPGYAPDSSNSEAKMAKLRDQLDDQYRSRLAGAPDEANRNLLRTAQRAWENYADAVLAFYRRDADGTEKSIVDADIHSRLIRRRLKGLARTDGTGDR